MQHPPPGPRIRPAIDATSGVAGLSGLACQGDRKLPSTRLGDATAEPQGGQKFLYPLVLYSGSVAELWGESPPLGAQT